MHDFCFTPASFKDNLKKNKKPKKTKVQAGITRKLAMLEAAKSNVVCRKFQQVKTLSTQDSYCLVTQAYMYPTYSGWLANNP